MFTFALIFGKLLQELKAKRNTILWLHFSIPLFKKFPNAIILRRKYYSRQTYSSVCGTKPLQKMLISYMQNFRTNYRPFFSSSPFFMYFQIAISNKLRKLLNYVMITILKIFINRLSMYFARSWKEKKNKSNVCSRLAPSYSFLCVFWIVIVLIIHSTFLLGIYFCEFCSMFFEILRFCGNIPCGK